MTQQDKGGQSMELLELLEFVNNSLERGKSLIATAKELGVNESTIRKKLNKNGYKRIGNKFVLQEAKEDDRQTDRHNVRQVQEILKVKPQEAESTTITTVNQEQFKNLMSNYNVLMEMVEHYKKSKVVPGDHNIIIELPHEEDKKAKYTLRLNDVVFKQFQEFCNKNKQFTQKELISMALLEYIKNHS